jgi:hypothetical protein
LTVDFERRVVVTNVDARSYEEPAAGVHCRGGGGANPAAASGVHQERYDWKSARTAIAPHGP